MIPYAYRLPPQWQRQAHREPSTRLPVWLVAIVAGFRAWQKGAAVMSHTTLGAPPSLALAARDRQRSVHQEELMAHIATLERQAKHLMRDLRADTLVDRIGLAHASASLEFGIMALRRAVMREPWI